MEQFIILIDSHVHIYNCYDIKRFFDCAIKNFIHKSKKIGSEKIGSEKFIGILFLTETKDDNYFQRLKENEFKDELKEVDLKVISHKEEHSIVYKYSNNIYLIIISGKQIITSEKIEVLALGTIENLNYGEGLKETVEKIKLIGALPVLPWGVGKWVGKRGRIIKNFLEDNSNTKYFLGDNSGRPSFLPTPKQFKLANEKGILIFGGL